MYTNLKEMTAKEVINKLNNLDPEENYYVADDKEFYYLSGLLYNKLKFMAEDSILQSSVFINIEGLLHKEYTEQKIKDVITKAYMVVLDKIPLDSEIGLLIAAILGYNIEGTETQETAKELYLLGQLNYRFLQLK